MYGTALISTATSLDELYFMHDWDNWVKELAFEWRVRHQADRKKSVFVGWHSVDVFWVLFSHREDVCAICPA